MRTNESIWEDVGYAKDHLSHLKLMFQEWIVDKESVNYKIIMRQIRFIEIAINDALAENEEEDDE